MLKIIGGVLAGLLAALPAVAQQLVQAGAPAARAGIAAAVSGEVKLAAVPGLREVARDVVSGDPVYLGDKVTTGAAGRLQIMLPDETVFTLGPNAALVIDKFVYDPATSAGKVSATVLQGTFRFVTGKVARREPSDMEVKLPVGSIGVRGTSVAGETDGTRATIVLLGPGPANDGGDRQGRILVSGVGATGAATTVEVSRPGFGTEITAANVPPSPAVRIDPVRLNAITAPLAGTAPKPAAAPNAPPAPASGSRSAQAPAAAAQPVSTGPSVVQQSGSGPAAGNLVKVAQISQVAASSGQPLTLPPPIARPIVRDGQTTFEDLRLINLSSASFVANNIALTAEHGSGSGTVNYLLVVDFRSYRATTSLNGTFTLNGVGGTIAYTSPGGNDFGNKSGPIGGANGNGNTGPLSGFTGGTFSGTLKDTPFNTGGKVAAFTDVSITIRDNTGADCASSNCISGRAKAPR